MDTLTRLMREAADLAPTGPARDGADPVGGPWRRGRRRRLVRGTATAAGTLAVLAVVASLVLGTSKLLPDQLLPADGGQRTGVTAYPQRIGHQWWTRELGDKAGPIAALVQVGAGTPEGSRWQAVSADGGRHELVGSGGGGGGEARPAVSANGQRIAYLQMPSNTWVIHDLRTGDRWSFPEIKLPPAEIRPWTPDGDSHALDMQSPAVFSPSGEVMFVSTADGPVVLDPTRGSVRVVNGMTQAIGWIDNDRLVGRFVGAEPSPSTSDTAVDVLVWSRTTGQLSTLGRVELGQLPVDGFLDGQWWGTVRADRTLWLCVSGEADGVRSLAGVSLPDLTPVDLAGEAAPTLSWQETTRRLGEAYAPIGEGIAWRRERPLMLGEDFDGLHVRPALAAGPTPTTTAIDDFVGVSRVIWAQNALEGSPSSSLLGTSTGWWTWWWKELALGFLALVGVQWWRHRRQPDQGVAGAWQAEPRE
ncbi:MAG: hypothetical protein ABIW49_04350 [Knoellia sp.]